MGKSLGACLSDNVLFLLQGIQREQRSMEHGGAQERWRMGIETLEQLVCRQKVSESDKSTWNV